MSILRGLSNRLCDRKTENTRRRCVGLVNVAYQLCPASICTKGTETGISATENLTHCDSGSITGLQSNTRVPGSSLSLNSPDTVNSKSDRCPYAEGTQFKQTIRTGRMNLLAAISISRTVLGKDRNPIDVGRSRLASSFRAAATERGSDPKRPEVSYQSFSPSRQAGWSRGDAKLKRDSYSSVVPGLADERQSPQALLLSVAPNASGDNALVALVQALAYLMSERRSDPLHQCGLAKISVPVSLSETGRFDLSLTKNTHHQ